MTITFDEYTLDNLDEVAGAIITQCQDSKIFAFYGDLGAGKTTLIKTMCKKLGYVGEVTSPTFSLINEYPAEGFMIFHMDLYRLKNTDELYEIGVDEYLYSGHYCFVEWPDLMLAIWDEDYYRVEIKHQNDETRRIDIIKR